MVGDGAAIRSGFAVEHGHRGLPTAGRDDALACENFTLDVYVHVYV